MTLLAKAHYFPHISSWSWFNILHNVNIPHTLPAEGTFFFVPLLSTFLRQLSFRRRGGENFDFGVFVLRLWACSKSKRKSFLFSFLQPPHSRQVGKQ